MPQFFPIFLTTLIAALNAHGKNNSILKAHTKIQKIAIGSCSSQDGHQKFWQPILKTQPDLFIYAGDVVYGSGKDLKHLQSAFKKLGQIPEYKNFSKKVPILAIWDDHDYGLNDGGSEHKWKKEASAVFLNFFNIPKNSPRRKRLGLYDSKIFGPKGARVQIILLDTRYFRSSLKKTKISRKGQERYIADSSSQKTILGKTQWTWLEGELKKTADLRLIVSSIQVAAKTHGWEKWGNFPKEKNKLLQLMKKTNAQRVLLLSGDRHLAGIYKIPTSPYPLYEMTSSSLNRPTFKNDETDPQLTHSPLVFENNFGLITINWEKKYLTLALTNLKGQRVVNKKILFKEIQQPTGIK